jgi:hypothetical protein
MALIECPECKHQISKKADTCPSCGHPIRRGFLGRAGTERFLNVGCLIYLLIMGVILAYYFLIGKE